MNGAMLIFPVLAIGVLAILLSRARVLLFDVINDLSLDLNPLKLALWIVILILTILACCILGGLIVALSMLVLTRLLSA
jgi:hypothetical protein